MKKRFKILLIVDIVLLLIYSFFRLLSNTDNIFMSLLDTIWGIIFFLLSLIVLVITVVLIIIEMNKEQDKATKSKLFKLMITMILINVCLPIGYHMKDIFISNANKKISNKVDSKYKKLSSIMIEKVKNVENNKYIYLYDDLIEIDNTFRNGPLNKEIDKGSYITYCDGKIRLCISDSNYKIYGNEDNLKTEKITSKQQSCNYGFTDIGDKLYQHNEGEYYLKYYINKKYGLEVNNVKPNYNCSLFYSCNLVNYTVDTSNGTITAKLSIVDSNIEETDNYGFVYTSQLLQKDLIDYMYSNNYTIKPYVTGGNSNLTDISNIDINNLNNELIIYFTVFIKKGNQSEENAKKIADKMINWYKDHNIYGTTSFYLLDREKYNDVNEDNYESVKLETPILRSCTIEKNGETTIK